MVSLNAKVACGVKLLNKIKPGWHRKVKLNDLNMMNENKCVLGQLYGEFYSAVKEVLGSELFGHNSCLDAGEPYGFSFTCEQLERNYINQESMYKELGEVWKAAIRKRRGK